MTFDENFARLSVKKPIIRLTKPDLTILGIQEVSDFFQEESKILRRRCMGQVGKWQEHPLAGKLLERRKI